MNFSIPSADAWRKAALASIVWHELYTMKRIPQSWFGRLNPHGGGKLLAGVLAGGLLFCASARGQNDYAIPYTFVTIAGTFDSFGDSDGTNGAALFAAPMGVAVDTNDNLFVVDNVKYTVRKVSPIGTNWVATTIAGIIDTEGHEDGTTLNSSFYYPTGIALDSAGNLYVTDSENNTVRKLTPVGTNWVSSTIAGTPTQSGSVDGTNGAARFNYPTAIAIDVAGKLYVADAFNNTIRLVAPVGTNWVVTTIAGSAIASGSADGTNQTAQFSYPDGIAVDASGNLFVSDSGNYTIRKITPMGTNWVVTTIAGQAGSAGSADGLNLDSQFNSYFLNYGLMGIAVDANDNLYVADAGNQLVREVSPVGTNWVTTTLAGVAGIIGGSDGTGTNALFDAPTGIAVDAAGRLFVTDTSAPDIWEGFVAAAPNLAISFSGLTGVVISWPGASSVTLQTNADLTSTNWGNYGGTVATSNGTNSVTLSPGAGSLFFRLSQ